MCLTILISPPDRVPQQRAADDCAGRQAAADASHPGEGARPARHGVDQGESQFLCKGGGAFL